MAGKLERVRLQLVYGKPEMAPLLGVERDTPQQWATRKRLPTPDHDPVNGADTWTAATVLRWANETNRLPPDLQRQLAAWLAGEGELPSEVLL